MRYQIKAWIEQHKDELVQELREWVRIRSVSDASKGMPGAPFGPECDNMLKHALDRARELGFTTENHDGYCGSVYYGAQVHQIGIAAHLDVVPEGNNWIYPPFGAELITENGEQYIVGRGVGDNKSMAVMGLYIMRCLRDIGAPLKHGLRLMLGMAEETGMNDFRHLNDIGAQFPDISLVPDAGFPVCYGQKGRITAEIEFEAGSSILAFNGGIAVNAVPDVASALIREIDPISLQELQQLNIKIERQPEGLLCTAFGTASHAASPDGSDNAIVKLARALVETRCLNDSSMQVVRSIKNLFADNYGAGFGMAREDDESGKLTLIGGTIRSRLDDKTQRVILTQSIDCRYPVTADPMGLRVDLCIAVSHAGGNLKAFNLEPAFFIPQTDPRVIALTKIYRDITADMTTQNYTMGGGTYSHVLPNAITFGGGLPNSSSIPPSFPPAHGAAHAPDESLRISTLFTTFQIYAESILALDVME